VKLYCITDSVAVAERSGADMIQVRATQLSGRALLDLVRAILRVAGNARVLVNTRLDVALAAGAHGVHLPADSIAPDRLRGAAPWAAAASQAARMATFSPPAGQAACEAAAARGAAPQWSSGLAVRQEDLLIGVSCHTADELQRAEREEADFAVFGPVFPTRSHPGAEPLGLERFASAVRGLRMPVYALGGITRENAESCISAGAAGIAGISFFETTY